MKIAALEKQMPKWHGFFCPKRTKQPKIKKNLHKHTPLLVITICHKSTLYVSSSDGKVLLVDYTNGVLMAHDLGVLLALPQ